MTETLSPLPSPIQVEAPLLDLTYTEIVQLALHFQTPLENTWTCARRGPRPCQTCDPCRARAAAFTEAALLDPLNAPVPT